MLKTLKNWKSVKLFRFNFKYLIFNQGQDTKQKIIFEKFLKQFLENEKNKFLNSQVSRTS
jgi:hypothetical protein